MRRCALLLVAAILTGCSAEAINVAEATLSDDATYAWLVSTTSEPKRRFLSTDEKATLTVTFSQNFVATYFFYEVEWIAPGDRVFRRTHTRTRWGTHRYLIVSLPIRDEEPARHPGQWKVRLYLHGRALLERSFEIVDPSS